MLVPWTALRPSLQSLRWRRVGIGIAALTAAALAAAAMASAPSSVRQVSLAILAVLTGVFSWIASRRQPARGRSAFQRRAKSSYAALTLPVNQSVNQRGRFSSPSLRRG